MSAEPRAPGWPAIVWQTSLLRGLDDVSRAALARAGRVIDVDPSQRRGAAREAGRSIDHTGATTIYRDGDDSDSFYVVAAGEVELHATRRGDVEVTLLRTARPGDSFGEEALLRGIPRRLAATTTAGATVVEIPIAVFQRITGRALGATADREQRYLQRAAARDLLACSAFARELAGDDTELLLDAVQLERMPRGTRIYEPGAVADRLFLVVEGLVQLQREDAAKPAITAYLSRGDFFGDQETLASIPRRTAAVASGDTWCAIIARAALQTLSDRNPGVLARMRRVAESQEAAQSDAIDAASAHSTQHVFRDLYRMQIARSLLVIEQDSCVRCGHCAWSCEQVHGTSRLVRRGDKIVTQLDGHAGAASLLLPNTCQHCRHAACMIDCPTGAIGRDPEGEVFIKPALCTGCGNCAKACPWENIQMAPRQGAGSPLVLLGSKRAQAAAPALSAEVAVKCDLCHGFEAPACVEACPTGAVLRLDPSRDVAEVARVLRMAPVTQHPERGSAAQLSAAADSIARGTSSMQRSTPTHTGGDPRASRAGHAGAASASTLAALRWSLGGAVAIAGSAAAWSLHHARGWTPARGVGFVAGIVAAALVVALAAYVIPKRAVRARMRRRAKADRLVAAERPAPRSRTRIHLGVHLALGVVVPAAALAHAGTSWRATSGGALAITLAATVLLGVLAAIAYRIVPRALTRLERRGTLPEDLAGEREALEARLYRAISGKSDRVKALVDHLLMPYARARLGWVALVASGRGRTDEARRLRARIDHMLAGRAVVADPAIDELVEIAVELRALPARRWLMRMLRVWPPLHAITGTAALALLVTHVVLAGSA